MQATAGRAAAPQWRGATGQAKLHASLPAQAPSSTVLWGATVPVEHVLAKGPLHATGARDIRRALRHRTCCVAVQNSYTDAAAPEPRQKGASSHTATSASASTSTSTATTTTVASKDAMNSGIAHSGRPRSSDPGHSGTGAIQEVAPQHYSALPDIRPGGGSLRTFAMEHSGLQDTKAPQPVIASSSGSPAPPGSSSSDGILRKRIQELSGLLQASLEAQERSSQQLHQAKARAQKAEAMVKAAEERAQVAEQQAHEAHTALLQAQEMSNKMMQHYQQLCDEMDTLRGQPPPEAAPAATEIPPELAEHVKQLQHELESQTTRMGMLERDLRAHALLLWAQQELSLHLAQLPPDTEQQVCHQIDSKVAPMLGDGGSAVVYGVALQDRQLAVKVMPLEDVRTAREHHLRDICTTFLRNSRCPYLEMPLHTFLRIKEDPEKPPLEATQYYLYTVWARRDMDVDQLLCQRGLQPEEILTIMYHTSVALQELNLSRMVHADVKCPNVLVTLSPEGKVVSAHLTDFGSVQYVPPGKIASAAIWDGQLAWNWPPEQRKEVHLDGSDTWALAMLYSCLKVHNPTKMDIVDVLQDMTVGQPVFERVRDKELLPDAPNDPPEVRELTRLMRRCIIRNPRQRPHIGELAEGIGALRQSFKQRTGSR